MSNKSSMNNQIFNEKYPKPNLYVTKNKEKVECPYCFGEIYAQAIKCKHCKSFLEVETTKQDYKEKIGMNGQSYGFIEKANTIKGKMQDLVSGIITQASVFNTLSIDISKLRSFFSKTAFLVDKIAFAFLLFVMISLFFFLLQSKLAGGAPHIFGHQILVVLSGSMSPTFEAGSVVAVKSVDPELLVKGDIITYQSAQSEEPLTTHRIVAVNDNNNLSFTTKGDANNTEDSIAVLADNVIGKVKFSIPYAGYIANYLQTRQGILIFLIVPGLIFIAYQVRLFIRYTSELEKGKEKKETTK